MTTRQAGIEKKIITSGITVSQMMTPGIKPSPKAKIIAKIEAEAIAKTVVAPLVSLTGGNIYTFVHNQGYIPIITIVNESSNNYGAVINIVGLTDTTASIYCGSSIVVTLYAH